jgi:uncharacterized membrane protein
VSNLNIEPIEAEMHSASLEKTRKPIPHFKAYLTMLISSLLSLTASLVLSVDAITLAKNSGAKLSCDINAIVSCGKVAASWQSNLLGFPNAYLGLILEPMIILIAVLGLTRMKFPKPFMKTALVGYGAGLLFAFWLLSQSYFVIKAFCPWCLLVTISTVTVFFSMLRINLLENTLNLKDALYEKISGLLLNHRDTIVVAGIYTIIISAVILKYGHAIFNN